MKIGIIGHRGRLGAQMVSMPDCVPIICDITNKENVFSEVRNIAPDVIVNCAAYTNVDRAEIEFDKALSVNSRAVAYLRDSFDGRLIHIGTDYVFDGRTGPYSEVWRAHSPFNAYGYSKSGGEIIATFYRDDVETLVVRTTGLYGGISGRPDFVSMVLGKLGDNKQIKVSNELLGNQTYIPHLAEAIYKLIYTKSSKKIIHVASQDIVSRYNFALMIAKEFGLNFNLIVPVKNSEIDGWIAYRPKSAGLLIKNALDLGLPIYSISDGITAYKEYINGKSI